MFTRGNRSFPFTVPVALVTSVVSAVLLTAGLLVPGGEPAGVALDLSAGGPGVTPAELTQTMDTLRRRLDATGAAQATVTPAAAGHIAVVYRGSDVTGLKATMTSAGRVRFALIEAGPASTPALLSEKYGGVVPRELGVVSGPSADGALSFYLVRLPVLIAGSDIEGATPTIDEYNLPAIKVFLKDDAVRQFGAFTRANVGRELAIVLNDKVVSAPRITGAIEQKELLITGTFTREEAAQLSLILRSGELPVTLKIVEEHALPGVPGHPVARWTGLGLGLLFGGAALLCWIGCFAGAGTSVVEQQQTAGR